MDRPVRPFPKIDPHRFPVESVDTQLPAVPLERLTAAALRNRFARPPQWEPEFRREPPFLQQRERAAAVLVPLIARPAGVSVLLTQRTDDLPTHPGQVAFPGGKVDADDRDARSAALREAHEEIGLDQRYVDVLGRMPVYVSGSRFSITPVVGMLRDGFVLHPNRGEVADVFEVPLRFLMDPSHHRHHSVHWDGRQRHWLSMPYLEREPGKAEPTERFIWGVTADMIRNLYRFLIA